MKTTELRNGFEFSYPCPAHFCQPTSSNSFPACIHFDWWEAPEIPMAEFSTHGRLHHCWKSLQINLRRKIIEDFIEEEGDFVTGNISGWFESSLTMLAGKGIWWRRLNESGRGSNAQIRTYSAAQKFSARGRCEQAWDQIFLTHNVRVYNLYSIPYCAQMYNMVTCTLRKLLKISLSPFKPHQHTIPFKSLNVEINTHGKAYTLVRCYSKCSIAKANTDK